MRECERRNVTGKLSELVEICGWAKSELGLMRLPSRYTMKRILLNANTINEHACSTRKQYKNVFKSGTSVIESSILEWVWEVWERGTSITGGQCHNKSMMFMVQTSSLNIAAFTLMPHLHYARVMLVFSYVRWWATNKDFCTSNFLNEVEHTWALQPKIYIATARTITPLQRQDEVAIYEEQGLPSQRFADLKAPSRDGFWGVIPDLALFSTMGFFSWIGWKRLRARQTR